MSQTKRKRKPKGEGDTSRYYFTSAVDEAIVEYNNSTDDFERSRIYQLKIKPAFEKLVECVINTFKYYYIGDQSMQQAQQEVVSFLVEKLGKFKPASGKAFSYFNMIAKHYCIQRNKANYRKLTSHYTLTSIGDSGVEDRLVDEGYEESNSLERFHNLFVDYWDSNLERLYSKKGDHYLASAIIELFRRRNSLELFNKKALYIYIREVADISGAPKPTTTPQITRMIKVIKAKYQEMYADYLRHGNLIRNKLY